MGSTDDQIFGGPLASTLEELKAQTSALYFTEWLAARGIVDRDLAERAHVRDMVWTFGHICRGMYNPEGKVKPYSALAAIQVGFLLKEGGLVWHPATTAANGRDRGCLDVDFAAFPAAVTKLEQVALGVKTRGDAAAARALETEYVRDAVASGEVLRVVTERWLRYPAARSCTPCRTDAPPLPVTALPARPAGRCPLARGTCGALTRARARSNVGGHGGGNVRAASRSRRCASPRARAPRRHRARRRHRRRRGHLPHALGGGRERDRAPRRSCAAWLAGGVVSLAGALCYAELATTYPHAGGDYHFLTRALGARRRFLFAWARLT